MLTGNPNNAGVLATIPGMTSAIIPEGDILIGRRYRAVVPFAVGSRVAPRAPSSMVYSAIDTETGAKVVIKSYRHDQESLRGVYQHEVEVHRALIGCPRIARMLACDHQRLLIVKEMIGGISFSDGKVYDNRGGTFRAIKRPVLSRRQVYEMLAQIVSIVLYGERHGYLVDHVLGGRALRSPGGAEPNVVFTENRGAIAVDVCDAPQSHEPNGCYRGTELRDSVLQRWLWLSRGSAAQDLPELAFADWPASIVNDPSARARLTDLRRGAVARLDPEFYVLADEAESVEQLHTGLERLANGDALERSSWSSLSTAPSTAPRVGRNDPCPCGSGKKSKKCCEGAA